MFPESLTGFPFLVFIYSDEAPEENLYGRYDQYDYPGDYYSGYARWDTRWDTDDIIQVKENYIFYYQRNAGTEKDGTVLVIDVSDPQKPAVVANIAFVPESGAVNVRLYLEGNRLVIVWETLGLLNEERLYPKYTSTHSAVYDITDPTDPKLYRTFAQDGRLMTSRFHNGYLTLICDKTVGMYPRDGTRLSKSKPETFIPFVLDSVVSDEAALIPAECFQLFRNKYTSPYLLIVSCYESSR